MDNQVGGWWDWLGGGMAKAHSVHTGAFYSM